MQYRTGHQIPDMKGMRSDSSDYKEFVSASKQFLRKPFGNKIHKSLFPKHERASMDQKVDDLRKKVVEYQENGEKSLWKKFTRVLDKLMAGVMALPYAKALKLATISCIEMLKAAGKRTCVYLLALALFYFDIPFFPLPSNWIVKGFQLSARSYYPAAFLIIFIDALVDVQMLTVMALIGVPLAIGLTTVEPKDIIDAAGKAGGAVFDAGFNAAKAGGSKVWDVAKENPGWASILLLTLLASLPLLNPGTAIAFSGVLAPFAALTGGAVGLLILASNGYTLLFTGAGAASF